MTNAQKMVFENVLVLYREKECLPINEKQISVFVNSFKKTLSSLFGDSAVAMTKEETEELIREIKRTVDINVDKGKNSYLVEKNHKPWYMAAKAQNENKYWSRYNDYLTFDKHYYKTVVNSIDTATDQIMDFIGNPRLPKGVSFLVRGLVLGDVQSGKTGTYIGLINKAADAGYKVIILLTGVIEKLRQQTQARVDEGFIGSDSSALVKGVTASAPIGVGKYSSNRDVVTTCLTSTENDFNATIANNVRSSLGTIKGPIILVVKKNKSVLKKLYQWFRTLNVSNKLDYPLLLIDDEADNASVNTNKPDANPTIINRCIRDLLNLFTKSSYIGFTATPYANIFIKPDTDDDMEKEDLFPKDFIYVLKRPSNYIGPEEIFQDDGRCSFMLKEIDDEDESEFLPECHKKDDDIGSDLPEALKEAICSFFIANAIRDLRQSENTHRSMLINISRFINIQNRIADAVDEFVRTYQRQIENYSLSRNPLSSKEIRFIKEVYETHFAHLNADVEGDTRMFTWEEILKVLRKAVTPIVVRAVNGENAPKNLRYSDYDDGLRVIVVGGFSLSRGLTLEGLCTSYYYRNSRMYDTLMQMGRWFGYRDNYADLCQIWINETSREWYREITTATKELKDDIGRMNNEGKTPKEFGLWVRSDSTALYVTAKNKMRNTETITRKITFSGRVIETPYLSKNEEENEDRRKKTRDFINSLLLFNNGFSSTEGLVRPSTPLFRNVPAKMVVEYLSGMNLSSDHIIIDTKLLINFIKGSASYSSWDVAIATGDGVGVWEFGGRIIKNVQRSFRITKYSYLISGKSSRVGDTAYYGVGLGKGLFSTLEKEKMKREGKALAQADLFAPGIKRNPLLIIFPVELYIGTKEKGSIKDYQDKLSVVQASGNQPRVALGLGFPYKYGEEPEEIKYTMNSIKRKNLLEMNEEDFVDDEADDFYD